MCKLLNTLEKEVAGVDLTITVDSANKREFSCQEAFKVGCLFDDNVANTQGRKVPAVTADGALRDLGNGCVALEGCRTLDCFHPCPASECKREILPHSH